MRKFMAKILKILVAIIVALLFSYLLFDSSAIVSACVFLAVWGISKDDIKNIKMLSKKITILLIAVVIIGFSLIILGRVVLHNDIIIVIGAMMFSTIVPLVLSFIMSKLVKIINFK